VIGWLRSEKNSSSTLMHTLLRVIWMLALLELGIGLLVLPWLVPGPWDANYFLSHYPVLRPYLLQPAVRGMISGLGALDVVIAGQMFRRRPQAAVNPNT
jgi:hypothetical protein